MTTTMIATAQTDSEATTYRGRFHYVTRGMNPETNPNFYHLPPLSAFGDVPLLPITDIRHSLSPGKPSQYTLSHHGFTARRQPSRLHSYPYSHSSWSDEELVKTVYMPEVVELVKGVTGCATVLIESAVLRTQLHSEVDALSKEPSAADFEHDDPGPCPRMIGFSDAGGASPAPKVHLDYSPVGARTHIRKYHRNLTLAAESVIEAENRLLASGVKWDELKNHYHGSPGKEDGVPRFALYSIWRPLKTVRRDPLALASCASFPKSDHLPADVVEPSGRGIPQHLRQIIDVEGRNIGPDLGEAAHLMNTYLAHAPRDEEGKSHDWHFISDQDPTEVLIIQLFDNEMEAVVDDSSEPKNTGVMHSAFELEGQDETGEARESLEVRVVAFW